MRTTGTLQDVFEVARDYHNGTADDGCPHDPEVRWDGTEWTLESGLSSGEDVEAYCTLEQFDIYFCGWYDDENAQVDKTTEEEFLKMISFD